jgi:hypothetical protein
MFIESSNSKNITSESEQEILYLNSTHNEFEELIQKPPPSSITITYMPDNVIEKNYMLSFSIGLG